MRSKVFQRIVSNTYRKLDYDVDSYAKMIVSGVRERFRYYFSWDQFNIGFGFGKCSEISGWKYILSLDLGFFSCWCYFKKVKNNL
jgi:hypothetical protein